MMRTTMDRPLARKVKPKIRMKSSLLGGMSVRMMDFFNSPLSFRSL